MSVSSSQRIGFHTMFFSLSLLIFVVVLSDVMRVVFGCYFFFVPLSLLVSYKKTIVSRLNVYFSAQTRFIGLIVISMPAIFTYLNLIFGWQRHASFHNCNEQFRQCYCCFFFLFRRRRRRCSTREKSKYGIQPISHLHNLKSVTYGKRGSWTSQYPALYEILSLSFCQLFLAYSLDVSLSISSLVCINYPVFCFCFSTRLHICHFSHQQFQQEKPLAFIIKCGGINF